MTMAELASRADMSWMRELRRDPEAAANAPNNTSRQVRSGHYVPVRPKPLPKPKLVMYSPVMAGELGLTEEACRSQEFLRFFSGDIDAVPGFDSWATPYALAIMGRPLTDNCPFKNGNGYGDGRAVSVGEVIAPSGQRWELQLKGGGQTPFCRGADGRAVLRSSVREFLASEAMHHLGISTTRAISLIVSEGETSQRPWYSGQNRDGPGADDPRIAGAPPELRSMLLAMLNQQKGEPDVMIREPCAITCRVAPSFTRIGHLDLFARRASKPGATAAQREEHEMMLLHAFNREYPDILPGAPLRERALAIYDAATERIATMVAGWLRVGFCQGNFNCDNCLIAGRTMDYGPFGFMDKFDAGFAKWVGSGDHFAFMNQPLAAVANLTTLGTALQPIFDEEGKSALRAKVDAVKDVCRNAAAATWRAKLGMSPNSEAGPQLFEDLQALMQKSSVDYTILFRKLADLPAAHGANPDSAGPADFQAIIGPAFYVQPSGDLQEEWATWLRRWLTALASGGMLDGAKDRMNASNPKYILRECMLVEAYQKAMAGDYSVVHELYQLIRNPYDEQPQFEGKYFRLAPASALEAPGTAVMT